MASRPDQLPAWQRLVRHRREIEAVHLRELFARDPRRGERMAAAACGLYLDYSKNRVTGETLGLLVALAEASGLRERIEAMFRGAPLNATEGRAVLHVALRAPRGERIEVDGRDVVPQVHAELERMLGFAARVRAGQHVGHTGRPIRNVVNLGIGGSDLGPLMAYEALRSYSDRGLCVRFVSNLDASDFAEAVRDLDPAETLFIVCSKSFTTLETLTNARTARAWCLARLSEEAAVARHFAAVSSEPARVADFGIDPENRFELWDWVGGRFSLDSAIGLSLAIGIGPERFRELLSGMRAMDEHFRDAPFERNLPVLMGLLAVWYASFLSAESRAVLPYDRYLWRFPAFLQQLEMESNGKSVGLDGTEVAWPTAPVVWGEPGTNGQHAFFQLLHQGTRLVPCDFIGFCRSRNPIGQHQDLLIANLLAQSQALAFGKTREEVLAEGVPEAQAAHRTFPGNRPSTTILADELTPACLGALVALYEHEVFVQGAVWGVNSFDQWGVELGKQLADRIAPQLAGGGEPSPTLDSSTDALIRRYRRARRAG
jgi:glucose-6-phosphate isomerase